MRQLLIHSLTIRLHLAELWKVRSLEVTTSPHTQFPFDNVSRSSELRAFQPLSSIFIFVFYRVTPKSVIWV